MSDNRNFDGPSAVERGAAEWNGQMLGNRMSDMANRRNNMSELKKIQGTLQAKSFDLAADGYGEQAAQAAEQADVYGQQAESLLPRYQDAQGYTNFAETVQSPNEMYDPARARMKNNTDITASFANKQAAGYIDPITATNRVNAAKLDDMLKQKGASYTWNGKVYNLQELQAERDKIKTKSMQEQYDEQTAAQKTGKTNPYAEETEEKKWQWTDAQERTISSQTAQLKKAKGWNDQEAADYYSQQMQALEPRRQQYEAWLDKQADAKWSTDIQHTMDSWVNDTLVPTYGQYVKKGTTRGAVRNNVQRGR